MKFRWTLIACLALLTSCGIIAMLLFYGKYLGNIMENHK